MFEVKKYSALSDHEIEGISNLNWKVDGQYGNWSTIVDSTYPTLKIEHIAVYRNNK